MSALGFVLIRAAVVANRRYLVGVPFLFQWFGFCLLALGYVVLVWVFTALWTWTAIDPVPALDPVCRGGRALSADRARCSPACGRAIR